MFTETWWECFRRTVLATWLGRQSKTVSRAASLVFVKISTELLNAFGTENNKHDAMCSLLTRRQTYRQYQCYTPVPYRSIVQSFVETSHHDDSEWYTLQTHPTKEA